MSLRWMLLVGTNRRRHCAASISVVETRSVDCMSSVIKLEVLKMNNKAGGGWS